MGAQERAERETEFGRIVGFTDGVIAIAITLLVLTFDVPDTTGSAQLADELADEWPEYLSFALSFAVIGRYWIVHHRFFGNLERFDERLIALNLAFLALIAVIPFPTELLGEYGGTSTATIIYAATMAAVGLLNWTMVEHAHRQGFVRPGALHAWPSLALAAVFMASIPVAFASATVAKLLWIAVLPARMLLSRRQPSV